MAGHDARQPPSPPLSIQFPNACTTGDPGGGRFGREGGIVAAQLGVSVVAAATCPTVIGRRAGHPDGKHGREC